MIVVIHDSLKIYQSAKINKKTTNKGIKWYIWNAVWMKFNTNNIFINIQSLLTIKFHCHLNIFYNFEPAHLHN